MFTDNPCPEGDTEDSRALVFTHIAHKLMPHIIDHVLWHNTFYLCPVKQIFDCLYLGRDDCIVLFADFKTCRFLPEADFISLHYHTDPGNGVEQMFPSVSLGHHLFALHTV